MPGPKEQPPDEVQRFMRVFISELLRLWQHGVRIPTESCPEGRLVRVILIAVCCDKPAAHKLGGFGSHSHTNFCTRDWIKQRQKATPEAFKEGSLPPRTNEQQRDYGAQYCGCQTKSTREAFVKTYATRWSELSRLPYFDMVRMIIIDPMHNLLLGKSVLTTVTSHLTVRIGLVKTHFYHIWVQGKILRKSRELALFHRILGNVSALDRNLTLYLKYYLPVYNACISWTTTIVNGNSSRWISHG